MNFCQIFSSIIFFNFQNLFILWLFHGFCVLLGCSNLCRWVFCFAKHYRWKLMREKSERYDPYKLVDFVFCFDQNSLRLNSWICFNHQIVEVCWLFKFCFSHVHGYGFITARGHFLCPCFSLQSYLLIVYASNIFQIEFF
jgi:hypothetical protein